MLIQKHEQKKTNKQTNKQTNNEVMIILIIQFNSILIYFRADLTA
jgi:hypothetical protein